MVYLRHSANSCIAKKLGGTHEAKEYITTRTSKQLAEEFHVSETTVFCWERVYRVKALRQCKNCKGIFQHHEMWINKKGLVQDSLCAAEVCKKSRHVPNKRRVEEAEFRIVNIPMPATPGDLRCYWVQQAYG